MLVHYIKHTRIQWVPKVNKAKAGRANSNEIGRQPEWSTRYFNGSHRMHELNRSLPTKYVEYKYIGNFHSSIINMRKSNRVNARKALQLVWCVRCKVQCSKKPFDGGRKSEWGNAWWQVIETKNQKFSKAVSLRVCVRSMPANLFDVICLERLYLVYDCVQCNICASLMTCLK